jgi:hypothetical protein
MIPLNNAYNNIGTFENPPPDYADYQRKANNYFRSKGYQTLEARISQQQNVNQDRWRVAATSSAFRSGSADGTPKRTTLGLTSTKNSFTFNIIDPACCRISGHQRNNRKDFELKAIHDEYSTVCDQQNTVLKYLSFRNHFAEVFSQACDCAMTEGFVLVEPYISSLPDLSCNIKWKIFHACDFIIDTNFRNADLSDCSYICTHELMPCQEAQVSFPGVSESIIWNRSPNTQQKQLFYFQAYTKEPATLLGFTSVTRLWQRKILERHFIVRADTREIIPVPKPLSEQDIAMLSYYLKAEITQKTTKINGWGLSIYLNNTPILIDEENPLGSLKAPAVPVFWNFRPSESAIASRFPSLPQLMADPQFMSNQTINMMMDAFMGRPQSGYYIHSTSNVDLNKLQNPQTVDTLVYEGEIPPQPIEPMLIPPSTMECIKMLREAAHAACPFNVKEESPEHAITQKSGVATMLDQADSLVSLKPILDGWDLSLRLLGDLTADIMRWNMPKEEAQSILGKGQEIDPRFFNYSESVLSTVVSTGLYTDTQKKATFNQWMEFSAITGTKFPAQALAKIIPMAGKDEVMAILDAQEKAMQAQAQEDAKWQNVLRQAQAKEFATRAEDNQALAKERTARAESNIGLAEERESEIEKNKTVSVKNLIDAMSNLIKATSDAGATTLDIEKVKRLIQDTYGSVDSSYEESNANRKSEV